MTENRPIELAGMITALRRSLEEAQRDGERTGGPRFRVEGIDLETTVQVTRDAKAVGGVRFWVAGAEAGAGRSDCATQRMTIRLSMADPALISGPDGGFHDLP
ncbi:hypothetical protein IAG44_01505 [Streptomyces roseirectus]|uniref:Trypsin-co-occurring domain-containing protein n=1 Tax=Streptomyces roseirectus TaxID=2768066 RepID=A0A7H0I658_9ACTN|nr:trypco2 family protein [Streptomyces roseirectus]QNP68274.1 hypothetical protein IAG44_01505 [Streptomyces roseirectus]